jgi:electron transport complex protein RnfA
VLDALLYGLAAAIGFALVMLTFTALRERVDRSDVPKPFRGLAIGMVTIGLMSLAFMGFAGMGAG